MCLMNVQATASLHEKAVQRVAADSHIYRRLHPSYPRDRVSYLRAVPDLSVHTLTVDRRVWATAMRLAGGDCKRIEIVSETEVIVR